MHCLISSRGYGYGHDFSWVEEGQGQTWQPCPEPIVVARLRAAGLLDSERPTVALARWSSEYHLLIGGIQSRTRRDVSGTPVRTRMVLIGGEANKRALCALTVFALRDVAEAGGVHGGGGQLQRLFDEAVTFDDAASGGYVVDGAVLPQRLLEAQTPAASVSRPAERRDGRSTNSPASMRSLAAEIEQGGLPDRDGFLVVMARAVNVDALAKARVWRGGTAAYGKGVDGRWDDLVGAVLSRPPAAARPGTSSRRPAPPGPRIMDRTLLLLVAALSVAIAVGTALTVLVIGL